jgi:hypothetical protein
MALTFTTLPDAARVATVDTQTKYRQAAQEFAAGEVATPHLNLNTLFSRRMAVAFRRGPPHTSPKKRQVDPAAAARGSKERSHEFPDPDSARLRFA